MASTSWRGPRTQPPALYWTLYGLAWLAMAAPLAWDLWAGQTGMDAAREQANVDMGRWAWRFLLATLAVRPAAQWLHRPLLLRYRRLLGLFAFAYALVHSVDYIAYAHAWAFPWRIWLRRGFLWPGIAATLAMTLLAATSLDGLRRRIGPVAWRRLHGAVHAVALLTIIHALWAQTFDYSQSIVCTILTVLLLTARLPWPKRVWPYRPSGPPAASARTTGNTRRLGS